MLRDSGCQADVTVAEAETLIREGIRLDRATRSDAGDPLSLLVFALRREQDRLSEVAPLVEAIARDAAAVWRPGLALLFVELGQRDAARRLFEQVAADARGRQAELEGRRQELRGRLERRARAGCTLERNGILPFISDSGA